MVALTAYREVTRGMQSQKGEAIQCECKVFEIYRKSSRIPSRLRQQLDITRSFAIVIISKFRIPSGSINTPHLFLICDLANDVIISLAVRDEHSEIGNGPTRSQNLIQILVASYFMSYVYLA